MEGRDGLTLDQFLALMARDPRLRARIADLARGPG